MICPTCKGGKTLLKKEQGKGCYEVVLGLCDRCHGTGEIKATNFQRITASPEALAKFVYEAESAYERCIKGDLSCDNCECKWCGLAGRKMLIDWLNEESE